MNGALTVSGRAELRRFLRGRVLLGFDFDGTLAAICDDPARAHMRARTRVLLARLAARSPTVVISGRRLVEVRALVGDVGCQALVGNHGLEWSEHAPANLGAASAAPWSRTLKSDLADEPGVHIEDKGYSLAVHFRQAADPERVAELIRSVARRLAGARLVEGKLLINVVPAIGIDKGTALEHLMRVLDCRRALFVGDDVTDEDVFALSRTKVMGIHVGREATTRARHRLLEQEHIDDLLELLLELTEPT